MFVKIYGRAGCPFCVRAKALAEKLQKEVPDFNFKYIDIIKSGLDKSDLSEMAGKKVTTVPQIFIDNKHVGGCTEFVALMDKTF